MIKEIINFIAANWVHWCFTGIFTLTAIGYKRIAKTLLAEKNKNKIIAQGVEALLRDRIIESYHRYETDGKCPIYAKENVRRLYIPYHKLGGNDVATELVDKLLEMPTA